MRQQVRQMIDCHLTLQQCPWQQRKQRLNLESHQAHHCNSHGNKNVMCSQAWQEWAQKLIKLPQKLRQRQLGQATHTPSTLSLALSRFRGRLSAANIPWWLQRTCYLLHHDMQSNAFCPQKASRDILSNCIQQTRAQLQELRGLVHAAQKLAVQLLQAFASIHLLSMARDHH